ncbi:hypothetical protein HK405_010790, partial [Cladochytrium tenue]
MEPIACGADGAAAGEPAGFLGVRGEDGDPAGRSALPTFVPVQARWMRGGGNQTLAPRDAAVATTSGGAPPVAQLSATPSSTPAAAFTAMPLDPAVAGLVASGAAIAVVAAAVATVAVWVLRRRLRRDAAAAAKPAPGGPRVSTSGGRTSSELFRPVDGVLAHHLQVASPATAGSPSTATPETRRARAATMPAPARPETPQGRLDQKGSNAVASVAAAASTRASVPTRVTATEVQRVGSVVGASSLSARTSAGLAWRPMSQGSAGSATLSRFRGCAEATGGDDDSLRHPERGSDHSDAEDDSDANADDDAATVVARGAQRRRAGGGGGGGQRRLSERRSLYGSAPSVAGPGGRGRGEGAAAAAAGGGGGGMRQRSHRTSRALEVAVVTDDDDDNEEDDDDERARERSGVRADGGRLCDEEEDEESGDADAKPARGG